MSPHPFGGIVTSRSYTCERVTTSHGSRGSRSVTFEVTYEDVEWMEPKRFVTKRDVSFAGLAQRVASAFPRTLRPGAPLGDAMGSTYGANFVLSADVTDFVCRGSGGTVIDRRREVIVIDSDVALRVALDAVQPPSPLPEVYWINCAALTKRSPKK